MLFFFGLEITKSAALFGRALAVGEEHALGRTFEGTMSRCIRSAAAWVLGDVSYLRHHVRVAKAEYEERDHLIAWLLFAGHHA